MTFDQRKLDHLLARAFQTSSMSDSKWVRLLQRLTADFPVLDCEVKLVWDHVVRRFPLSGAQYRFDFWERGVEGLIPREPAGWTLYREIEWLEFPAYHERPLNTDNLKAGTEAVAQGLLAIRATIEGVGQFDLYCEPNGLRLYAYR